MAITCNLKPERKLKILIRDNWTCYLCGEKLIKDENATVDHLIPYVFSGKDSADNLSACCKKCNDERARDTQDHMKDVRELIEGGLSSEKVYKYIIERYYS